MEGRSILEFAAFVWSLPLLEMMPRGDGHAVLVIPPFAVSDGYTQPLRWFLARMGYDVHGWELGPNFGMTETARDGLPVRFLEINEHAGATVSIVGWSAGGILARQLARDHPRGANGDHARGAVPDPLPRPLRDPRVTAVPAGRTSPSPTVAAFLARRNGAGAVAGAGQLHLQPHRRGGAMAPLSRRGRAERENIEVISSHIGLGHNPAGHVRDRRSPRQPVGEWKPFRATVVPALLSGAGDLVAADTRPTGVRAEAVERPCATGMQ